MDTRQLGTGGPVVGTIGLGAMGMSSGVYGPADDAEGIATVHAALDAGVTLIDTGDFYAMGHNELLIREALRGRRREGVVLSVKFGALRGPAGEWGGMDTRPAAVKNFVAYSLRRLGVDHIDIYRPARLDPAVPIEDTVGAIAELIQAGYVRHVGLSEVGADTIRRAHAVYPIAALQSEYSLWERNLEPRIIPLLRELGIGLVPFAPLGRGFLTGAVKRAEEYPEGDYRRGDPRYQGENFDANVRAASAVREMGARKGVTAGQIALAWLLHKGPDIVPIPGSKRRQHLEENAGAAAVSLSAEDLAALDAALSPEKIAGPRYNEKQMAHVDR